MPSVLALWLVAGRRLKLVGECKRVYIDIINNDRRIPLPTLSRTVHERHGNHELELQGLRAGIAWSVPMTVAWETREGDSTI